MTYCEAYKLCCKKAYLHFEKLNAALFEPGETVSGDYYENYPNTDFASSRWVWLTSMITGMAPLVFETESDTNALKWANRFKGEYHNKVFAPFTQTMHDLGFLYLPYSVHLYQLTGDPHHRDTALRAADELAKRFCIKGKYIDAWSRLNEPCKQGRMIVDSVMNVPLLYWAWKETGHKFYYDIANAHIDTVINTLVRDDYSVAHAWFFDSATGEKIAEANNCGFANGSHWARGTAWLVFGLAAAYSYTQNEYYLTTAVKVGKKYLSCLNGNVIPVWDFRLPEGEPAKFCCNTTGVSAHWDETKKENTVYNVDTSAAAIMSCGFMLTASFGTYPEFEKYADDALLALSQNYVLTDDTKPAILTRVNGRDVCAAYADYYYMLALAMKVHKITGPWSFGGYLG